MRIKIDENLPAQLADVLANMGHDAQTVPQEGLGGKDDPTVWKAAQRERRFLLTQDMDFSDVRSFPPGKHHGILILRLRAPSRAALMHRVTSIFRTEDVQDWDSCFVVASDHKIRVTKPPRSDTR